MLLHRETPAGVRLRRRSNCTDPRITFNGVKTHTRSAAPAISCMAWRSRVRLLHLSVDSAVSLTYGQVFLIALQTEVQPHSSVTLLRNFRLAEIPCCPAELSHDGMVGFYAAFTRLSTPSNRRSGGVFPRHYLCANAPALKRQFGYMGRGRPHLCRNMQWKHGDFGLNPEHPPFGF
jgi:hypothetical protein